MRAVQQRRRNPLKRGAHNLFELQVRKTGVRELIWGTPKRYMGVYMTQTNYHMHRNNGKQENRNKIAKTSE